MEVLKKLGAMALLCFLASFALCKAYNIEVSGNYHLHFYSAKLRLFALLVDWLGDSFGAFAPALLMVAIAGFCGVVLYTQVTEA